MADSIANGPLVALGRVVVTAAGTNETIFKNKTDFDTAAERRSNAPLGRFKAAKVFVQADPGNTGNIFVGLTGMDATDAAGPLVLAELQPGSGFTVDAQHMNVLNPGDFEIDAGTSGDAAYCSFLKQ
jgi:hypothetical protein